MLTFMLWLLALPATAAAQDALPQAIPALDVYCADAVTQPELNECSDARRQAADTRLNAAYAEAIAAMRRLDAATTPPLGAETALRTAQRAWIAYRDTACEAEAIRYRGGSMVPMMIAECHARLSERRTADLRLLPID